MHQGDQDGLKGVYHINAVDMVTQWELTASVEHITVKVTMLAKPICYR